MRKTSLTLILRLLLILANLCLAVVCLSGWRGPLVQNDKKQILQLVSLVKEPIEVSFKLNGMVPKSKETFLEADGFRSQEFEGDADWVKNLTLRITNVSAKPITYVVINLHFPEATKNGRTALHPIILGEDPDGKVMRPAIRLDPHQSLEIPLTARHGELKTLVESVGSNFHIENVSKIWVEFHAALLDDGTLYQAGTFYRRNPQAGDPRKWIKIEQ